MRRLGVLVAVLVLGAWTCQAPVDHGGVEPMAGPTTTGLAALLTGEDWHYVGSGGDEPAFENDWENSPTQPALAFRRREAGIVDVQGSVVNAVDPTIDLFTLPVEYRPSTQTFVVAVGFNGGGDTVPFLLSVATDGTVAPLTNDPTVVAVVVAGQFFLDPPVLAP